MRVFKFGGASVRDAEGIKNLAGIISSEKGNLVIVISALGKTTNALEIVLKSWISNEKVWKDHLEAVYLYHMSVLEKLIPDYNETQNPIKESYEFLKAYLSNTP